MGWFFRKSLKVGPVRLNLSKRGIGASVGIKGFRIGVSSSGRSYVHAGRHGLYYRQELGSFSDRAPVNETGLPKSHFEFSVTKYDSALSKDLFPSTHQELLAKLNQSYKMFRVDYLVGIAFLIIAFSLFQFNQTGAVFASVFGAILFAITAKWETERRTIQLFYDFEDKDGVNFKKVVEAVNYLASCNTVWVVIDSQIVYDPHEAKRNAGASSLVNRTKAKIGEGTPPWVETNIDVPIIKARSQALYMMPDGILVYDDTGVGFVDYQELKIESGKTSFIEERPPSDAKVIGTTWKHPNKNGGPDRRFNNNYEVPICLYGELMFQSFKGMNFYFMTSRGAAPENFVSSMFGEPDEESQSENHFSNENDEDSLRKGELIETQDSRLFRKMVSVKNDSEKQSVSMICPYCSNEFEAEIDLIESLKAGVGVSVEVNAICPFCVENLNGDIAMQPPTD